MQGVVDPDVDGKEADAVEFEPLHVDDDVPREEVGVLGEADIDDLRLGARGMTALPSASMNLIVNRCASLVPGLEADPRRPSAQCGCT